MKNLKIQKNLTYEEISDIVDISPQQIHKIEKEALNTIFNRLCNFSQFTPVEIILSVCETFGMNPEQYYKKLNDSNKDILLNYVVEHYGKEVPGFQVTDIVSIESLFG